jgi:hypothetical protein
MELAKQNFKLAKNNVKLIFYIFETVLALDKHKILC